MKEILRIKGGIPISSDYLKNLLKKISETSGPSGGEERIREAIRKEISDYADDIRVDALGNLIAKKGSGPKLMVAAHMDEIGIVVTYIDQKGFLRFSPVGWVTPIAVLGQRVIFSNGIIGTFGEEKRESTHDEMRFDKMYLDIGARDKTEAESMVKVGDVATFQREMVEQGERLIGKAMDDRAGCAILVLTLRELKKFAYEVYFVFTVQEEVGIRGAITSAYGIEPQIGIAVDLTATGDTPEAHPMAVSLGKGPAIKVKDRMIVTHPKVRNQIIKIAQEEKIPYQLEVLEHGGTDAGAIHLSREGVPTGAISIPGRYIHTPSEMIDYQDLNSARLLLMRFLEKPLAL